MSRLTNRGTNGEIWITDNDETRQYGRKETAFKKLADYEDKQEQGLLIELPVPIGEEVYSIIGREIRKKRVLSYQTAPRNVGGVIARGYNGTILGFVGKNVFATRSEAEEALAKMGGKA